MPSLGPRFPGTGATLANSGTSENAEAWVSPGNIVSDNATDASITAATYDSPDISDLLVGSNFGFTIPFNAGIVGIIVEIERNNAAGAASDNRVQLAKGTTFASLVGNNKADTALDWPASMTVASYGSSTDLWGATWTPAEINASSFAVFMSVQADAANTDVAVDFYRVTVHYVEPTQIQRHRGDTFTFPPGRLMPRQQVSAQDRGAVIQQFEQALDAVVTVVGSITKSVGKILNAAVTVVATLTAFKVINQALNAAVTVVATMTKEVGKILNAVVSVVASITKSVGKTLNAVVTVVASLEALKVFLKTLDATVTVVATMTRSVGKLLDAVVSVVATMTRSVGKILTDAVVVQATLEALKAVLKSLDATVTVAATMTRSLGKILGAAVTVVPTMTKSVGKILTDAVVIQASLSAFKTIVKTLSAAVTVVATMSRSISKTLAAVVTIAATVTKSVTKTLSASVTAVASMIADPFIAGAVLVVNRFRTAARGRLGSRPRLGRFGTKPRGKSGSNPEE